MATATATAIAAPAVISIAESTLYPNNGLFDVTFNSDVIRTTVTSDPTVVTAWISAVTAWIFSVRAPTLIGLDIEWRPNFTSGSENPAATLQLCAPGPTSPACLIFQLLHCPSLPRFVFEFLADERFTFVGVGIACDAKKLVGDYDLKVKKLVDLTNLEVEGRKNLGLKVMVRLVMGVEVAKPKKVTMSKWDCRWLSYQQIQYACVDAYLSFQIGTKLLLPPPSF